MSPTQPTPTRIPMLLAILLGRCPRCRQGRVFRGQIKMYAACRVCGFRFGREEGYYTGAMYASYFLSIGALTVIGLLVWFVLGSYLGLGPLMLIATAVFLLFIPTIFRYSRIIWLYIDVAVDPSQLKMPD